MNHADLFRSCLEGDVFMVTLHKQVSRMEDSFALREQQSLSSEFSHSPAKHAIIDFQQLSYFTSVLLEALIQLWRVVNSRNGRMLLCELSQIGREIIAVSHLDELWTVCETREDAMRLASADIFPEE